MAGPNLGGRSLSDSHAHLTIAKARMMMVMALLSPPQRTALQQAWNSVYTTIAAAELT